MTILMDLRISFKKGGKNVFNFVYWYPIADFQFPSLNSAVNQQQNDTHIIQQIPQNI